MKYAKGSHCKELNAVKYYEPYLICHSCGTKCNNPEFVPLDLGCGLE